MSQRTRATLLLNSPAMLIALVEVAAVLVLRAHYTMDVFTGIVIGLYAAHLAGSISTSKEQPGPA